MMKKSPLAATLALCLVILSACSTSSGLKREEVQSESPQPKTMTTKESEGRETEQKVDPSPVVEVTPKTRPFEGMCFSSDFTKNTVVTNMEEALSLPSELRYSCELRLTDGQFYPFEKTTLDATGYNPESLHILYEQCLRQHIYGTEARPLSPSQSNEAKATFMLCPEHPDRASIEERIREGERLEKLKTEGRVFGPGVFKVGGQIQPGSYYSEVYGDQPFKSCYWELLDESGEILDNNFAADAFRVEVTIPDYAYSFSSKGCGEFKPIPE